MLESLLAVEVAAAAISILSRACCCWCLLRRGTALARGAALAFGWLLP